MISFVITALWMILSTCKSNEFHVAIPGGMYHIDVSADATIVMLTIFDTAHAFHTYYGIGFGQTDMSCCAYAITFDPENGLKERKLDFYNIGTEITPKTWFIEDYAEEDDKIVIVASRANEGAEYTFDPAATTLDVIVAKGLIDDETKIPQRHTDREGKQLECVVCDGGVSVDEDGDDNDTEEEGEDITDDDTTGDVGEDTTVGDDVGDDDTTVGDDGDDDTEDGETTAEDDDGDDTEEGEDTTVVVEDDDGDDYSDRDGLCCGCTSELKSRGCKEDIMCTRMVCSADRYCCAYAWDKMCAADAQYQCEFDLSMTEDEQVNVVDYSKFSFYIIVTIAVFNVFGIMMYCAQRPGDAKLAAKF